MDGVFPSLVLGFHGCDREIAGRVFAGRTILKASQNEYDWLGHGVYFWENNPKRALEYAQLLQTQPKSHIREPAVVGAVIDLGLCMNLLDAEFIQLMKDGYQILNASHESSGDPLPTNKTARGSNDLLLRHLDCAVVETVHTARQDEGQAPFDSVRGVFVEGKEIYPGAGINEFNHIQICVRNSQRIKGYFRVLNSTGDLY